MSSAKKFDIVVYGATGFTGQLVAEYLAAHYKNGKELKWAMAGRSLDKLKSVRDAIGAPADTPLIVGRCRATLASLKAMVGQTRSVLTTVGPYQMVRQRPDRGLRRIRYRLSRSLRRAGLDAADDRQARGGSESERRAYRVLLRLRLRAVRTRRRSTFRKKPRRVFGAPAARVKGRVRDMRGTFSGGTAASGRATFEAVSKDLSLVADPERCLRVDAGFQGAEAAEGQQAGL